MGRCVVATAPGGRAGSWPQLWPVSLVWRLAIRAHPAVQLESLKTWWGGCPWGLLGAGALLDRPRLRGLRLVALSRPRTVTGPQGAAGYKASCRPLARRW